MQSKKAGPKSSKCCEQPKPEAKSRSIKQPPMGFNSSLQKMPRDGSDYLCPVYSNLQNALLLAALNLEVQHFHLG
jgi:hypothetical protein